ncbi:zinc finger protein 23-like isoform X5 [Athalia rosae]|uniref:zinc finger protein 23-like isoform X5 n=1 Tax=Athalia rosae TaxID=37344 RepID=UPI0020345200|nr:zinc finger protein 23-like isoform X5 [Athalia rosae]
MALEEEAQICRLCGQCESIYIDVFGEEGTKRYLSLKIHTKVNILDEIKVEDTPVSSVNNNNTNQNQNPPDIVINDADDIDCFKEEEQSSSWNVAPATTDNTPRILIDVKRVKPSSRNIPVEHHNGITITGNVVQSVTTSSTPLDILPNDDILSIQIPSTKNILPEFDIDEICRSVPIANRLRSQGNNSESNSLVTRHTLDRPRFLQENDDVIQIPTSALNKVLTTIANSDNTQVTVKESTSVNDANGDLNFLVELRRKKNAELVTILAKVFPDQGSCIVDRGAIIKLLENQNDSEMQAIVAKVLGQFNSNEDDINNGETKLVVGRNPEDLFRMDGEEISVEENIEQVSVENRTRYICRLCRKKYSRKDKCTVHVKTHLGIKQYLCTLCPAKFVCKSDVLKHIRSTHTNPRPFQCPKCPRRLRSKFDLIEHDNVHEGIKPYSCSECGLRYHHKVSLQMHAKSHLPSQNLACEYCGNVFPFRTRLLSHIASVHMKNRRNFRCHFCYNLYSSLSVLNNHIKSSHAATHVCEICGKEFKVKSKYKTHVLQHENPRPFSCPVCKNKYASRTFLSEHLSKHQGIRKHICQKCGATFAQASHLAAHRHVHGEKKYSCPDCGRRFNRQDNMKVHRKRHFKPASTRPKEQNRLPKQSPKENSTPPSSD